MHRRMRETAKMGAKNGSGTGREQRLFINLPSREAHRLAKTPRAFGCNKVRHRVNIRSLAAPCDIAKHRNLPLLIWDPKGAVCACEKIE